MHAIKTDFDSASYEVAWFKSNWNRVVLEAWDNGNIFYALSIISPGWNYDISLLAMLSLECWHGTFNTSTIEHHKDRDCLQLYSQDCQVSMQSMSLSAMLYSMVICVSGSMSIGNRKVEMFTFSWVPKTQPAVQIRPDFYQVPWTLLDPRRSHPLPKEMHLKCAKSCSLLWSAG